MKRTPKLVTKIKDNQIEDAVNLYLSWLKQISEEFTTSYMNCFVNDDIAYGFDTDGLIQMTPPKTSKDYCIKFNVCTSIEETLSVSYTFNRVCKCFNTAYGLVRRIRDGSLYLADKRLTPEENGYKYFKRMMSEAII